MVVVEAYTAKRMYAFTLAPSYHGPIARNIRWSTTRDKSHMIHVILLISGPRITVGTSWVVAGKK